MTRAKHKHPAPHPSVEGPRCNRCGILSGPGHMSQALRPQVYRIRQPKTQEEAGAMQARLTGWKNWDDRTIPKTLRDGYYVFELQVCEQCYDSPVLVEVVTRHSFKAIALWSPGLDDPRP